MSWSKNRLIVYSILIVRIHHLTAGWQNAAPFFRDREKSTLEFNDKALELLDRFLACLKEEGIYVTCEITDSALTPALSEIPNTLSPIFAHRKYPKICDNSPVKMPYPLAFVLAIVTACIDVALRKIREKRVATT